MGVESDGVDDSDIAASIPIEPIVRFTTDLPKRKGKTDLYAHGQQQYNKVIIIRPRRSSTRSSDNAVQVIHATSEPGGNYLHHGNRSVRLDRNGADPKTTVNPMRDTTHFLGAGARLTFDCERRKHVWRTPLLGERSHKPGAPR